MTSVFCHQFIDTVAASMPDIDHRYEQKSERNIALHGEKCDKIEKTKTKSNAHEREK